MPDISVKRNHTLEPDDLRKRLEQLASEMSQKFGIKSRWDGDTCLLSGSALKNGRLEMGSSEVSLELTLGMMGRMFKTKIEEEIDKRLGKILD